MPASVTIWHFEEANLLEKGSGDRHTYSIRGTCCKHFQACSTPPFDCNLDQKWYLAALPFYSESDETHLFFARISPGYHETATTCI